MSKRRPQASSSSSLSPSTATPLAPPHHIANSQRIPALYDFICTDIIKGLGHLLLVPFLTTNDLLQLSECSKPLVNYRQHLSRIKIVPHPATVITPGIRRALSQLLDEQQNLIELLSLSEFSLAPMLDHGGWYGCSKVKRLELSGKEIRGEFVGSLCRGMSGGNF